LQGAEKMIMSTMEELYTNGRIEGEVEISIKNILKLLNKRFKRVPESISSAVNSYTDIVELDSLFDRALECKTLAEFEEGLVYF
jgi:ABC-type long-subunit fatty acid transport system fused permease/ATPase subunit